MRKQKWFVPVVVILSVLLIGGITGGIVAASDDSSSADDQTQLADRYQMLLDRVCDIYEEQTGMAIDAEQLKDAVQQARGELREEALEKWLRKLVDDGELIQEEADQLLQWWQSRPDVELPLPALGRFARGLQIRITPWCGLGAPDEAGT